MKDLKNDILPLFAGNEKLPVACRELLSYLGPDYNQNNNDNRFDLKSQYEKRYGKPDQSLSAILGCIAEAYLVAILDTKLFEKREEESLDDTLESLRAESEEEEQADSDTDSPADEQADSDAAPKYDALMIFAVDIKGEKPLTRTEQAVLTRAFNRISYKFPVILIIREGNKLSIANCERTNYLHKEGEKVGRVAILRGIDCLHPHRGHLDIIEGMKLTGAERNFDALYTKWTMVFSSEVLTKGFYDELFGWYQWAVSEEAHVTFPNNTEIQEDDREDIDTKIIRLITRLLFVWFIKQKKLVPDWIFDVNELKKILKDFNPEDEKVGNYYNAILQNLFFGTLNRPILENGDGRQFAKATSKDAGNLYRYAEMFRISEAEVIEKFKTVPYLNCGLFDCQDKCKTLDGVKKRYYNDGFSRNGQRFSDGTYKYRAVVPNRLFFDEKKGIISIFEKYVFTVEENTPQDVQVALDPELLGKVFENLLGAYNPETKETARKESGSFYTPREIVQYMVDESLVAYLKQKVSDSLEGEYRQLLEYSTDKISWEDRLTAEQRKQIIHALFTCKILDPACGSGAFPMGMLQQMVHILQQLDPDNSQWREKMVNLAADEALYAFGIEKEEDRNRKIEDIKQTFNDNLNSPDYTRKLYLIESCIYGVDIQPIAMLITRLRFFITLICEQENVLWDKPEENYGIKTLPNLETKFVAANSLLSAKIRKFEDEKNGKADWTQDDTLKKRKDDLITVRRRHFYTRKRSEKIALLKKDEEIRGAIHKVISTLVGKPDQKLIDDCEQQIKKYRQQLQQYQGAKWVVKEERLLFGDPTVQRIDENKEQRDRINGKIKDCEKTIEREKHKSMPCGFEEAVLEITEWNPYDQNAVSPFFDPEWMFGITDGFDIVIGNPPYIQLQNNGGALGNLYKDCGYETFASTGDIYCLFYERGLQLLRSGGHLCYITSNKWMRAGYGENTRNFFAEKTDPQLLIDFAGVKVFESATVDTNILLFAKAKNRHQTICAVTNKQNKDCVTNLSVFVQQQHTVCDFAGSGSWVILSPIEQSIKRKIEAVGTPLKDWDIQINYGIKTGYNEAFIISTEKRNEILSHTADYVAGQAEEDYAPTGEYRRTAEIIRPILRGRDIKRYGYNWANLWLINTHNGVKENGKVKIPRIDIKDYPAIKAHLDSYWDKIESRADQGDTPYNLRNCAYMDDFNQQKICWKAVGRNLAFALVPAGIYLTAPACFISAGVHNEYILAFLCSNVGRYFIYKNSDTTGAGDIMLNIQSLVKFPIPPTTKYLEQIHSAIEKQDDIALNKAVYDTYSFSTEEQKQIESL